MAKVTSLVAKTIMDVRKLAALSQTLSKHFPDERMVSVSSFRMMCIL